MEITKNECPRKLVISFSYTKKDKDGNIIGANPQHSEPFILTSDQKLIALRDSYFASGKKDLIESLEKKGLSIILPKTIYGSSYQGDANSCHAIALAVLKDITKPELEKYAKFENGYEIPAKILKYSQSLTYASQQNDNNLGQIIKSNSKTTLKNYISDNKKEIVLDKKNEEIYGKQFETRISTKSIKKYKTIIDRFIELANKEEFPNLPEIVKKIIEEEKQLKPSLDIKFLSSDKIDLSSNKKNRNS